MAAFLEENRNPTVAFLYLNMCNTSRRRANALRRDDQRYQLMWTHYKATFVDNMTVKNDNDREEKR